MRPATPEERRRAREAAEAAAAAERAARRAREAAEAADADGRAARSASAAPAAPPPIALPNVDKPRRTAAQVDALFDAFAGAAQERELRARYRHDVESWSEAGGRAVSLADLKAAELLISVVGRREADGDVSADDQAAAAMLIAAIGQ